MKEFDILKSKVKAKSNIDTNLSVFCENDNIDNKKIEDYTIDYKLINRDNYSFRLFTYERKLPVKKDDFKNKFDYMMKTFYFLKVFINDDKDIIEMTIDRKDNESDIHKLYIEYLDKIDSMKIDELFSQFSDIIE